MDNWQARYEMWSSNDQLVEPIKIQLNELINDRQELEDCFYKNLTFGTGGMRGVLGPGTNRMNIYTVRKAVKGLAHYLEKSSVNYFDRGVVVAYDSRYMSKEFAVEVAKVLGVHGIKTYIFQSLRPTPLLSFAVRYLGAVAGIMITASHNPPQYNGFKVYNEQGSQITSDEANAVINQIDNIDNELTIPTYTMEQLEDERLIHWLTDEVDSAYLKELLKITKLNNEQLADKKDLRIVFTPLHGTALNLVTKGLTQLNFTDIHIVEAQAVADPEFSTVSSPNPEEEQAFTEAIKLGKKVNADILLATDPDADRLGIAAKNKAGNYDLITGNQLGVLLLDYLLKHLETNQTANLRMLKTIVTTELATAIATAHDIKTINTLTGFKYIGEKINEYDSTGETFVFGFEESYGYLISGFARDKDAVQAAVMACEMANYWKEKNLTIGEALQEIYASYGYYYEALGSLTLEGKAGAEQITDIVNKFRNEAIDEIGNIIVEVKEDYLLQERTYLDGKQEMEKITLPQENVIKYLLTDNCWVCIRPSGTEPKLKWYYGSYGESEQASRQRLTVLKEALEDLIVKPVHNQ